jgi:DNA-binding transcriptional MerR regulator
MAAPPDALKLSEVRKACGIDVETLRMLVQDGLLPHVRAGNGHVYIRSSQVPSYGDVVELVERRLGELLAHAREQLRRVEVEMEAVRNDLDLAIEDPRAELGHDLLTLRAYSSDPHASSLTSALAHLGTDSMNVRFYHHALRQALESVPG